MCYPAGADSETAARRTLLPKIAVRYVRFRSRMCCGFMGISLIGYGSLYRKQPSWPKHILISKGAAANDMRRKKISKRCTHRTITRV
ncbi:uncharacterized protein ASCRUDRAFT_74316 [Ascoidea rubescens DSM 1968]|uniref:Uncharacterized protein n=1 Tax=Ascoidea rubescens DSM 1968 TaxID=1344418 RepID=A0A1D2VMN1_9ASCO|nr:hypothetical protein ASCRUDRAFT_74316 [Ascoidea rubescens DSM 1968]ODV62860.1 hypothetical protein ASCRUDRAFT_74316 [Ascoidea rubescens DSM 1968]